MADYSICGDKRGSGGDRQTERTSEIASEALNDGEVLLYFIHLARVVLEVFLWN